jgi:hypothetical protein
MIHLTEEDLVLIYYGEPDVPEDVRRHLADCTDCRAAADALAQTLNLCSELPVPEPDAGFELRVWPDGRRVWSMPGVWIGVAAAVVLIVSAFLLGRATRPPQPPILAGLSAQARERILEISLADHLDRADIVLTEISNTGDLAGERNQAEDLVEEGRLLRQTLARRGESATLSVFDDIQRVLLEVANGDPAESPELRQHIGDSSLVFKARIMESNLRTQGQKL